MTIVATITSELGSTFSFDKFLTADGTLTTEIMADGLHPTLKGYGIWADAIRDKVKELLRKA